MWKLLGNALPLGLNLASLGLSANAIRLLLSYPFSSELWDIAPVLHKPNLSPNMQLHSLLLSARQMLFLPPVGLSNPPIFPWTLAVVLLKAITDAKAWSAAEALIPLQTAKPSTPAPPIPVPSIHLCFVDATWMADSGNSGLGWTFQSANRFSGSASAFVPCALAAEALGVKHALSSALDHELTHIQVFSDSQTLVCLLIAKESTVELRGILFDISLLCLQFISLSFHYIPRSCNSLADSLAKRALVSLNLLPAGV
ncbi:hypothetical protein CARUB_v10011765mg [Capsella rubella]|uniref:RNase H type-1 domain-containing protein n=1 Tax=Capsella rubella TaxID=81985 RepID=R0I5K1_9BRAS|nr:hypothetical protein CARUB_v10011765mg [Capsella rubella]